MKARRCSTVGIANHVHSFLSNSRAQCLFSITSTHDLRVSSLFALTSILYRTGNYRFRVIYANPSVGRAPNYYHTLRSPFFPLSPVFSCFSVHFAVRRESFILFDHSAAVRPKIHNFIWFQNVISYFTIVLAPPPSSIRSHNKFTISSQRYLIFIWRNRWMRLLSRIIQFAGEKFAERLTNIFFYRWQTLNVSIPKQHNETFKQSKFRQSKHFRAKQRESLVRRILRSGPQLFICINRKRESVKFHGMHEERIKYPEYSVFVWYLYTCLTVFSKIWISLKIRSQPENNW